MTTIANQAIVRVAEFAAPGNLTSIFGARTVAAGFRGWHVANQLFPWARLVIAIAMLVHHHLA